jgi:hypothetical protein
MGAQARRTTGRFTHRQHSRAVLPGINVFQDTCLLPLPLAIAKIRLRHFQSLDKEFGAVSKSPHVLSTRIRIRACIGRPLIDSWATCGTA